jgi:hypothetical protein
MSLKTKTLSLFDRVLALVVLGGWSLRLREMGGVSRRIIANNYDSSWPLRQKESLERQDSAALFLLAEQPEAALKHCVNTVAGLISLLPKRRQHHRAVRTRSLKRFAGARRLLQTF